jgi:hypothetical protein
VIAYNLGNLWRRLVLPKKIGNWSLTRTVRSLNFEISLSYFNS